MKLLKNLAANDHCPLEGDIDVILKLGDDLTLALRRLRKDMTRCWECPIGGGCALNAYFQKRISLAIDEINLEWKMTNA